MRGLTIAGALFGMTMAVHPASATVYTYIVSGMVDAAASEDQQGYFGSLDGAAFTATFTIDDANTRSLYQYGSSSSSARGGGLVQADTLPPVDGQLRIGGVTVPIPRGNFHQEPYVDPDYGDISGERINEADRGTAAKDAAAGTLGLEAGYSYSYAQYLSGIFGYGMDTSRSLTFSLASTDFTDPDFRQAGSFALSPNSTGAFAAAYSYGGSEGPQVNYSNVYLRPTQLTVSGAVPEPAAWMTFVLGFGVVGFAMRHGAARRNAAAAPHRA